MVFQFHFSTNSWTFSVFIREIVYYNEAIEHTHANAVHDTWSWLMYVWVFVWEKGRVREKKVNNYLLTIPWAYILCVRLVKCVGSPREKRGRSKIDHISFSLGRVSSANDLQLKWRKIPAKLRPIIWYDAAAATIAIKLPQRYASKR